MLSQVLGLEVAAVVDEELKVGGEPDTAVASAVASVASVASVMTKRNLLTFCIRQTKNGHPPAPKRYSPQIKRNPLKWIFLETLVERC